MAIIYRSPNQPEERISLERWWMMNGDTLSRAESAEPFHNSHVTGVLVGAPLGIMSVAISHWFMAVFLAPLVIAAAIFVALGISRRIVILFGKSPKRIDSFESKMGLTFVVMIAISGGGLALWMMSHMFAFAWACSFH